MMDSGKMLSKIFMASESSVSTPFTMDCTQVASDLTLRWALIRANSSPLFTGLLRAYSYTDTLSWGPTESHKTDFRW